MHATASSRREVKTTQGTNKGLIIWRKVSHRMRHKLSVNRLPQGRGDVGANVLDSSEGVATILSRRSTVQPIVGTAAGHDCAGPRRGARKHPTEVPQQRT